jgi:hypothetical protein
LRVFENRVLRRIFGVKRDEVMGGWRKLHNEEHHMYVCMYVCVRGGPNQPLHRDPQWSIVLPLL